jgi:hypothetical protein
MTRKREQATDPGLLALRAAGYCGAAHPSGRAHCTRTPGHAGDHVDYYNGRTTVTDTEGFRWRE